MHSPGPDSEIKLTGHPEGTAEAAQCYGGVMQKVMHPPHTPVLKKTEPRLPHRLAHASLHPSHRPVVAQTRCIVLEQQPSDSRLAQTAITRKAWLSFLEQTVHLKRWTEM